MEDVQKIAKALAGNESVVLFEYVMFVFKECNRKVVVL